MAFHIISRITVGADLSCAPPIHRPFVPYYDIPFELLQFIIGPRDFHDIPLNLLNFIQ